MSPPTVEVTRSAPLPQGYISLDAVTVRIRPGGVNVRAAPDIASAKVGALQENQPVRAVGLVFAGDHLWLRVPWQSADGHAWIAAGFTDFPRQPAYRAAVAAWYESEPVLAFRRGLLRDLLRARRADPDEIERAAGLRGAALVKLEDTLTRQAVPPGYVRLWQLQERLGLPDPFAHWPVQPIPPADLAGTGFNGFGPNLFAYHHWDLYYTHTRGMHPGIDFNVSEGTPLLAVADGVIVEFRFLANRAERSLALRPYLPERFRTRTGERALSNLIVAYGHLTGDPTATLVRAGDSVQAGDVIGTSGWPIYTDEAGRVQVQHNNAHLHLETHLVTDGTQDLGSRQPFNPLLFWTPRLVAWMARLATVGGGRPYPQDGQPYGRLGFFSVGCFSYEPPRPTVWEYEPTRTAFWPPGVYGPDEMIKLVQTFVPYNAL